MLHIQFPNDVATTIGIIWFGGHRNKILLVQKEERDRPPQTNQGDEWKGGTALACNHYIGADECILHIWTMEKT